MGRLTYRNSTGRAFINHTYFNWEDGVAYKLAHYEDMEEAGRLIELPCAVGDTAYFITVNAEGEYIIGSGKFSYLWLDYPRMIYATKEEAEAKLKELEGDKE